MSGRAVATVCAALVLAACSGPVAVDDVPELPAAQEATCRDFVADLPDVLVDRERVDVEDDDRTAAWGDPAIVLVCGAALPDSYDDFSSCAEADGVGWFVPPAEVEDRDADVTITAVGHQPVVSVTVPVDYRPAGAAAAMSGLAPAVREHLVEVNPCT